MGRFPRCRLLHHLLPPPRQGSPELPPVCLQFHADSPLQLPHRRARKGPVPRNPQYRFRRLRRQQRRQFRRRAGGRRSHARSLVQPVADAATLGRRRLSATAPLGGMSLPGLWNLGLIVLFGLQHSLMARGWWKRLVPIRRKRLLYVLSSVAVLGLIAWLWQPKPIPVWPLEGWVALGLYGVWTCGLQLILFSAIS